MNDNKPRGHAGLIEDLEALLEEAHAFEFHDLKNHKYPLPKMSLHEKLMNIDRCVQNGEYDDHE